MRLRVAPAVVCSMVLAACGGSEGDFDKVPSESDLAAASDTCSESTYNWPPAATDAQKVCAGPWQYQYCNMGSSSPSSCKHAVKFGQYVYQTVQAATSCKQVCDFWAIECDMYAGKGCMKICDSWSTVCTFPGCSTSTTTVPAATAVNAVNAARTGCSMPATAPPVAVLSATITDDPVNVQSRTCTVTVDGSPRGHVNGAESDSGPLNTCDSVADNAALCGWDQSKVTVAACPDPPTANLDGSPQSVVDPSQAPDPAQLYTAPGLTRSSVLVTGKKPPLCLTCEGDSPLGVDSPDTQVQYKFQCLANRHSDVAAGRLTYAVAKDPNLDKKLVQGAELLFEFRGQQLSATQRITAEGLYTANPAWFPGCSQTPDWAAPTASCSGALDGKLIMCDRLADLHSSPGVALLEANYCVGAWNDVTALSCSAKGDYAAAWAGISTNELRKAFSQLSDTDPVARRSRLQDRMSLAATWYADLLAVNEPVEQRWRDSGVVAGAIVQGAYSNQLANLDAASTVATRDQLVLGSSAADQELIQSAFANTVATGQPPLKSAPLLFILSYALRASSDRLNEIDFIHDLGCRFRSDCGASLPTRVSEMHALLSAVADGSKLSANLLLSADVPQGWRDTFQVMSGPGHALIENAVRDALGLAPTASYAPELITNAAQDQVPVNALGAIVNLSRMKADHYAQTGRFRPGETMALETGLLQSKLNDVRTVAKGARDALALDHGLYDSSFQKLIDDQLAIVRGTNGQSNANSALSLKSEQLRQTAQDLDGLRVAATVDLSRFGAAGQEYDKLVTAMEQSGPGFTPHWNSGPFSVPPSQAKHGGGPLPTNLTSLAISVGPGPVHMLPGTLLQVEAHGQWSPTCAINVSAPSFKPPLQGYTGSMTGPQGYGLSYSNGQYNTESQSGQDFNFWDGARVIAGASSSIGGGIGAILAGGAAGSVAGPVGTVIGAGVGAAISIVAGLFGSDHDNHSNGTEYHKTAAFNAGLHVQSAPFPAFPAGALLAVKMKHLGTTSADLLDVEVVQSPYTTMLAENDIDVYLAVNDLACASPGPLGALTVTLETLEPRTTSARRVQQAMATSASDIQSRINQLLVQGRVLSSDLQSARSQAMTTLLTNCSDCLSTAFAPFLQYYTNWVDIQLNQAERQIEIGKVERQLRVAAMEWEALAAQVLQAQRDSAILALLPSWAAQNIDETRMKNDTEQLVRVLDRYVYPFLRAKYPETLRGWPGTSGLLTDAAAQAAFAQITSGLDWTANWGFLADSTVSAYDLIQQKLDLADLSFKSQLPPFRVAISIPKPISMLDSDVDRSQYAFGYGTPDGQPFVTYTPPYHELDTSTSAAIWAAISSNSPVKITVPAESLYNAISSSAYKYDGQLSCGEVLPVVTNIGVYVANDAPPDITTWNAQQRQLPVHSSVHVNYLAATGPEPFYGTNGAWLKFPIQPLYGPVKGATTTLVATGGGQGLSPAGELTIEPGYREWLDPNVPDLFGSEHRHALALVLVLEVERRISGDSVSWVQQCH